MTVGQLHDFLGNYMEDCEVSMLQCSNDSPLDDDIGIADVIAIESATNATKIVLIPE